MPLGHGQAATSIARGRWSDGLEIRRSSTDRQFDRASLTVGTVVRVKRGFSAAMGCCARLSSDCARAPMPGWPRAVGLAGAGASKPAGARRREQARRRAQANGDVGGYHAMRWSNSKAGLGGSAGEGVGPCSALTASHSGWPRAGAMRVGAVGSPRWARMSRTVERSVMKAMIRISAPQCGHSSGKTSSHRDFLRS